MPTIAIFIHQPKCSIESANGIIQALSPKYRVKIFTRFEIEDGFFNDVDIIAFPGGFGDADSYVKIAVDHFCAILNHWLLITQECKEINN
jgi:hypothetical protein